MKKSKFTEEHIRLHCGAVRCWAMDFDHVPYFNGGQKADAEAPKLQLKLFGNRANVTMDAASKVDCAGTCGGASAFAS